MNGVNAVSRAVVDGRMTPDEAYARLEQLRDESSPFSPLLLVLGSALCATSFTLMFGGGAKDALITAITACLAYMFCLFMDRHRPKPLATVLFGAFISALLPGIAARHMTLMLDAVIAGAVMPFVPGLAMTNAVADLIRGDMLSGVSHGFSALLTAGMIALGTVLASGLLQMLGGI